MPPIKTYSSIEEKKKYLQSLVDKKIYYQTSTYVYVGTLYAYVYVENGKYFHITLKDAITFDKGIKATFPSQREVLMINYGSQLPTELTKEQNAELHHRSRKTRMKKFYFLIRTKRHNYHNFTFVDWYEIL